MIKFEFIVDEADAENIFSCIREAALRIDQNITDMMGPGCPPEIAEKYVSLYKRDKEYLLGLIEKMSNTKV